VFKQPTNGLALAGTTGSANDFALLTPGATAIMWNPTGTQNIAFAASVSMGALTATTGLFTQTSGASVTIGTNGTNGSDASPLKTYLIFQGSGAANNLGYITCEDRLYNRWGSFMRFNVRDSSGTASEVMVLSGSDASATFASTVAATTFSGSGSGITALGTSTSYQVGSFGVGTTASGTSGEIRATNNITAYYSSDIRLKENIINITNPIDKVMKLNGVSFDWTEDYIKQYGGEDGFFIRKKNLGLIAQEVEKVLPELVATREDGYLAIKQDNTGLIALLVEVVKNQELRIQQLEKLLG